MGSSCRAVAEKRAEMLKVAPSQASWYVHCLFEMPFGLRYQIITVSHRGAVPKLIIVSSQFISLGTVLSKGS